MRRAPLSTALATLGGLGRAPVGPGTWGTLAGLGAGWLAVQTVTMPAAAVIVAGGFVVSAVICTAAEQSLGQHDAPCIVLDEAWAMAAVVLVAPWTAATHPGWLIAAFALFRCFDIVKPPPLKGLARCPRGWGIMADDAGAAVYTLLVLWAARALLSVSPA